MMRETPKTIRQYLGRESAVSVEQINALDEEHLLGLDKPVHEIISRGQSEKFPLVTRLVYEARGAEHTTDALLARFGLSPGVYDAETNSQGILAVSPPQDKTRKTIAEGLLLRLMGTRADLIQQFFQKQILSASNYDEFVSSAARESVARTDRLRETFAFRHPEKFPAIHKLLAEIEAQTDLKPEDLFREGNIPPLFQWVPGHGGGPSILLEKSLVILNYVFSGKKNMAEIRRLTGVSNPAQTFLKPGGRLSDRALEVVEQKLKKGR